MKLSEKDDFLVLVAACLDKRKIQYDPKQLEADFSEKLDKCTLEERREAFDILLEEFDSVETE